MPIRLPKNEEFLSLNELESAASFLAPVLLGFLNPSVASHKTARSQVLSQGLVVLDQGPRNAELDRARLTRNAAAADIGLYIPSAIHADVDQRTLNENLENRTTKILVEIAAVDRDISFTGNQPYPCDRPLAVDV